MCAVPLFLYTPLTVRLLQLVRLLLMVLLLWLLLQLSLMPLWWQVMLMRELIVAYPPIRAASNLTVKLALFRLYGNVSDQAVDRGFKGQQVLATPLVVTVASSTTFGFTQCRSQDIPMIQPV